MEDVHAILEGVSVIKILAVEGKKIAKDGISLADLPEALELIKHIDEFITFAKDVKLVAAEAKDVDQAEIIQIGAAIFDLIKAIKEA